MKCLNLKSNGIPMRGFNVYLCNSCYESINENSKSKNTKNTFYEHEVNILKENNLILSTEIILLNKMLGEQCQKINEFRKQNTSLSLKIIQKKKVLYCWKEIVMEKKTKAFAVRTRD